MLYMGLLWFTQESCALGFPMVFKHQFLTTSQSMIDVVFVAYHMIPNDTADGRNPEPVAT